MYDRHQTANLMDRNGEIIDITGDRDVMFLLSNMQDEVHRFAISTFRRKHAKSQTRSVMDELPGIGEKSGPVRRYIGTSRQVPLFCKRESGVE